MNHIEKARFLRKVPTPVEVQMWSLLRRRQLDRLHFRRQHRIGPYFADFYCDAVRLVIELDGSIHDTPRQVEADQQRDAYLRSLGVEVLRIRNEEIAADFEVVVERIREVCRERAAVGSLPHRRIAPGRIPTT